MTSFRGPRQAAQPAKSGDPSFFSATGGKGKGPISDAGIESAQMAPVNRRLRTKQSQGEGGAPQFKGYGATLK